MRKLIKGKMNELTVELELPADFVASLVERGLGVGGVLDDALDVVAVVLGVGEVLEGLHEVPLAVLLHVLLLVVYLALQQKTCLNVYRCLRL